MDSDLGGRITMVSVALTPPRDDVVPVGFADRAPTGRQTHTGFLRNRKHCAVTGELVLVVHVLDAGGKHGLGLPTQTPVTTDGGHHACPRGSKGLAITDLPSRGQTLGCFALGLLAVCALMGLLAYRARNAYYFHRFGLCPLPVSSRGGLSFPASGQLKKSQFSRFWFASLSGAKTVTKPSTSRHTKSSPQYSTVPIICPPPYVLYSCAGWMSDHTRSVDQP